MSMETALEIEGYGLVEFGDWKDAGLGLAGVKERVSLSKHNIWTWEMPERGIPIQQEAYIVERITTLRDPNVNYFLWSVPNEEMGYSNPFKDYWPTASYGYEIGYVYRGCTSTLDEMMEWAIRLFEDGKCEATQKVAHYDERLETCYRVLGK